METFIRPEGVTDGEWSRMLEELYREASKEPGYGLEGGRQWNFLQADIAANRKSPAPWTGQ